MATSPPFGTARGQAPSGYSSPAGTTSPRPPPLPFGARPRPLPSKSQKSTAAGASIIGHDLHLWFSASASSLLCSVGATVDDVPNEAHCGMVIPVAGALDFGRAVENHLVPGAFQATEPVGENLHKVQL